MKTISISTTHLLAAALLAMAAARCPAADATLSWKPHRDAGGDGPASGEPPAAAAAVQEVTAVPPTAGGPAAVVLPDEVPRVPQPRRFDAATPSDRPAASRVVRDRPVRIPPPAAGRGRESDDSDDSSVFGLKMRNPQGESTRRILAPEGRQAMAMEQRAERVELAAARDGRLGGGLAPRYAATPGARPRIDRIAMGADGLPSVMAEAQRPQVGGLDDSQVPGRAPSSAASATPPGTATRLPSPATEPPAAGSGMNAGIESFEQGFDGDAGPTGDEFSLGAADPGSGAADGLLLGDYPAELHVESFYDDPYACEDDDPLCHHSGRICSWLRRFGKPYYGWRWYRDFTASAGITAFTNDTNLGIHGNFGTNEYLNWAMPFWNAFGIGWQIGWRGTQTNFQPAKLTANDVPFSRDSRTQNFVTTGFFTRAFEGRGLQGGAVYDYLGDSWLDNADISQIRAEVSYVWGYHEIGFWGAANVYDQNSWFGTRRAIRGVASTTDLYTGFYRLQFGDANELKVWGGGTGEGEGILGTLLRAPLSRTFAMEGTFTYLVPGQTRAIDVTSAGLRSEFSPAAWNLGLNLVYYPAGRSRRSLASPYRPLFEVADNGSMIRQFDLAPTSP